MKPAKCSPVIALAIFWLISPAHADQALIGATVIDGTGAPAVENAVILISGDRITCVGTREDCIVDDVATRVDLTGSFVTPGLVDTHVHFGQTGWIAGRTDLVPNLYPIDRIHAELRANPERWHRSYLCSGVTAVFDMGGSPWTISETQGDNLTRSDRVHVRAAGPLFTYYENSADRFVHLQSEQQITADVQRLAILGSAGIKVLYPEPPFDRHDEFAPVLAMAGKAARDAGIPLLVHATELHAAKSALRAGASTLVHSVWDAPVDDEFLTLLAANEAYYAPTMVVNFNWMRTTGSILSGQPAEVDDPNQCVDAETMKRIGEVEKIRAEAGEENMTPLSRLLRGAFNSGNRYAFSQVNLRAVRDAGGRILLATDAGNSLTVHGPSVNWELEAMEAAGLTPDEIIHAATLQGARMMNMDEEIGSLEPGKLADLLVLAADPRETVKHFRSLTYVMRAGVLKKQAELRVR